MLSNSPASNGLRANLRNIIDFCKISYVNIEVEMVSIENSSGGFLTHVLRLGKKHELTSGGNWLLIGEPEGSGSKIESYLKSELKIERKLSELETELGISWSSADFELDLCLPDVDFKNLPGNYDVLLSQALLEHIVDPVQLIKNLNVLLKKDGILVIHTHNPLMGLHRFPVDTLRYNEDFFHSLQNYVSMELLDVSLAGNAIFAVLKKKS